MSLSLTHSSKVFSSPQPPELETEVGLSQGEVAGGQRRVSPDKGQKRRHDQGHAAGAFAARELLEGAKQASYGPTPSTRISSPLRFHLRPG